MELIEKEDGKLYHPDVDYTICHHCTNDQEDATLEEIEDSLCGKPAVTSVEILVTMPDFPLCEEHAPLYADWTWMDSMSIVDDVMKEMA